MNYQLTVDSYQPEVVQTLRSPHPHFALYWHLTPDNWQLVIMNSQFPGHFIAQAIAVYAISIYQDALQSRLAFDPIQYFFIAGIGNTLETIDFHDLEIINIELPFMADKTIILEVKINSKPPLPQAVYRFGQCIVCVHINEFDEVKGTNRGSKDF